MKLSNRDQRTVDRIRDGSTVPFRDLVHLLETVGFRLARQRGSHHMYKHPQIAGAINVQPFGADAKKYQAGQVLDVLVSNQLIGS